MIRRQREHFMKKKSNTQSAFYNPRLTIVCVLCLTSVFVAGASSTFGSFSTLLRLTLFTQHNQTGEIGAPSRTLSFVERVKYQRAIEQVYWNHRIWPETNTKPKPPLDQLISQSEIEHQVKTYLDQSQELDSSNPITPEQLQAEMDRMAQNTRKPEMLREVFAALDDDPAVIAECFARPLVSAQLTSSAKGAIPNKPAAVASA